MAYILLRDHIIGPKKCLAMLPKNTYFNYREDGNLDYLRFSYHEDLNIEDFTYILHSQFLRDVQKSDTMAIETSRFSVVSVYDSLYNQMLERWCIASDDGERCFLTSPNAKFKTVFANNLESVDRYLKCFFGEWGK